MQFKMMFPDKLYGIGMKRAVFKLGTDIRIRSTYREKDGSRQPFAVPIAVGNWLANDDPPWDFDIVEDGALDEDGVEIVVNTLTSGAATSFGSPAFLQKISDGPSLEIIRFTSTGA